MSSALHDSPATIEENNFIFKSLSSFSLNLFMGCSHGCSMCSVPGTSTNKQKPLLKSYEVNDPVGGWGSYVLVRPWDEAKFMASLRKADEKDPRLLNRDGNRAVILCSTTDPYQVIRSDNPVSRKLINLCARNTRRNALMGIRDYSTLNVRVLTRSPLAREDFDLFKTFGNRLLLGTSLPTLDPRISRFYEGKTSAPRQRLQLLLDANAAGIPTYVAVAPVFPEVGYQGMLDVFNAVKAANPHTIFMEPVNNRLGIVERIQRAARDLNQEIDMTPYTDRKVWAEYAIRSLRDAEQAAEEAGVSGRLHLWPDRDDLTTKAVVSRQPDQSAYLEWLQSCWDRISEWPGKIAQP